MTQAQGATAAAQRWYTVGEAAKLVGLSRWTVLREIRCGQLRASRPRCHFRVRADDLRAYALRTGARDYPLTRA